MATGQVPKSIENAPAVWECSLPYWEAFWMLTDSRPVSLGAAGAWIGYVPLSEISVYLDETGIEDRELRQDFMALVRAMDAVYVAHANKPKPKLRPGA